MNHDLLMKRCISLGLKALGNTYPNPNVGALLFYDGKIISEGFTKLTPSVLLASKISLIFSASD